jgi:ubiquinone/menaquinone biosynthesis C-methylase UbiE
VTRRTYVPAAGRDWLLPLYDPFTNWLGVASVHRRLIDQAEIQPGQRVLEIGCGTGNLTILAKRLHPSTEVVGIDPDLRALAQARRKAARSAVHVTFVPGYAEELPYPDGAFDRVVSALMFHHLHPDAKHRALLETRRVLKTSGSLHLVDFVAGSEPARGLLSRLLQPSHGARRAGADSLPALLEQAGFGEVREIACQALIVGRIGYYRAALPASAAPSAA